MSRRWALFEREDIRDERTGELYLRRWRIVQTPWGGLLLHKILTPDKDRHLHDHPWGFIGVVLRGGYREAVGVAFLDEGRRSVRVAVRRPHRRPFRPWFKRSTDAHRIVHLRATPTWTLLLVGPRRRSWGFHTEQGWVDWRVYLGRYLLLKRAAYWRPGSRGYTHHKAAAGHYSWSECVQLCHADHEPVSMIPADEAPPLSHYAAGVQPEDIRARG